MVLMIRELYAENLAWSTAYVAEPIKGVGVLKDLLFTLHFQHTEGLQLVFIRP
jgi:hypothetical protein